MLKYIFELSGIILEIIFIKNKKNTNRRLPEDSVLSF